MAISKLSIATCIDMQWSFPLFIIPHIYGINTISLIEGWSLLTRNLLKQGFLVVQRSHHLQSFTIATINFVNCYRISVSLFNRYGICFTNDHGYVPIVVITISSFPHSLLIARFVTRVTQWVSLVEQEQLILP
jgi:hypothetical protein